MTRASKLGFLSMALATALGACGDDGGPKTDTTLSASEAQAIGNQAVSQVAALVGGVGSFSFAESNLTQGFFTAGSPGGGILTTARRMAGSRPTVQALLLDPPAGCTPDVNGDPADDDGDGIPNGASYSFNALNCSYTDTDNNTTTVTGSVSLGDHGSSLYGYDVAFNNWRVSVATPSSGTTYVELDGAADADVVSSAAAAHEDYAVTLFLDASNNITFSNAWVFTYAPGQSQVIDPADGVFPSGDVGLAGTFRLSGEFGGESGNWAFSIAAPTLTFDPACPENDYIVGGTLQGAITARNSVGFDVTYHDCGTPPDVTPFGAT
jgi:hypothetical protein